MNYLYSSPLRVYLCLGALALCGIYAGAKLPISLFPNSSKPIVLVGLPYGNLTPTEFMHQHGNHLESQLRGISSDAAEVEKTRTFYNQGSLQFEIEFMWGSQARSAIREVETVVQSYAAQLPDEIRSRMWIEPDTKASGFYIASFYSATRSLDELYKIIEPVIVPELTELRDAASPVFWNPTEKEIRIELNIERMSAFQLLPKDIEQAVRLALIASNGGTITVGLQKLTVQLPRLINGLDDLKHILIPTPSKQSIHLSDVARIDYDLKTLNTWSFKTNSAPSLFLFVRPRLTGNIKRMSEKITDILKTSMSKLPGDVEYKVIVDPSEFIRSSIQNVFQEVAIGAFLAVLVLFVFIGSFRNTVTAAIEIPISMILAFIPMKLSGMSINLISLGGLALSAGMNVDASVVVMENIFRHFKKQKNQQNAESRLRIVARAVNEVKFAVISSTLTSLVVFLPLAFTSDLSYAILGDLAKAVVFSHGFSALVALILVPTIRLHLMSKGKDWVSDSPFEKYISKLEDYYVNSLSRFVYNQKLQNLTYMTLAGVLILLSILIIPNLPKEVIGSPVTKDIMLMVSTEGNTVLKQMEDLSDEVEQKLQTRFGSQIEYSIVNSFDPNQSWILARLKDKAQMRAIQKKMQNFFKNTPTVKYNISPFNPAELPIPNPPQLRIAVRGGSLDDRVTLTRDLYQLLDENQVFPRLWTVPSISKTDSVILEPHSQIWSNLKNQNSNISPIDIADLVRVMTNGKKIGDVIIDDFKKNIFMKYSSQLKGMNVEEIGSIPIGMESHLVPLKALTQVKLVESRPAIYQENQRELFLIFGKLNNEDSFRITQERLNKAKDLVKKWILFQNQQQKSRIGSSPTIMFEDAAIDVHEAINQLLFAFLVSIALIFLILILQFGDIVNALLVLVAIPVGLIGVLLSLFIFQSTLSLNSILGVILLNGIAVANSIILVDFLRQRVKQGLPPSLAALDAAKKRLRPILITSLTTILAMLPIALGFGEGGQILQPLGIAVSGGLWVSMGLTLLLVPALQVRYLEWKLKKQNLMNPTNFGEAEVST